MTEEVYEECISELQKPYVYFERYIQESCFEDMAVFMNIRHVETTGKSLNCSPQEIKKFWGVSIVLSLLGFPRIRMCWERRTRYPLICENISRDRFYHLRNNIKVVDDNAVSNEEKQDRFWKVRPFVNRIRDTCLQNHRSKAVCIDEQMIPFHGQVRMRQYVRGKPNPVGLKNFVVASPGGIPLDFILYEGKGKEIIPEKSPLPEKLDIGGRVVLKLADSLPGGSSIYVDRYFTSVKLLETLQNNRHIFCTGTIMASRLPKSATFVKDREMSRKDRGSFDQIVREDDKIAIVKWFDNRPIYVASSKHGVSPVEKCSRWSKKDKTRIDIPRPFSVGQYNINMGGVDLLDRVIGKYAMRGRTSKWTVRIIHHFFDFAIASAWLQYRSAAEKNGLARKDILPYYLFKLDIGEKLIFSQSVREIPEESDINHDDDSFDVSAHTSSQKRRLPVPMPPKAKRTKSAMHLPENMDTEQKNRSKCRAPGCKGLTFIRCTYCKVFLCFTSSRNCFLSFHSEN